MLGVALAASAPLLVALVAGAQSSRARNPEPASIDAFDTVERWSGGTLDTEHVRQGRAGLELTAAANSVTFVDREIAVPRRPEPWRLVFWVYTDAPENIGRVCVLASMGAKKNLDDTIGSTGGLVKGWNRVVMTPRRYYKAWYSRFEWPKTSTLGLRLEANGNGPAAITIDDMRIEPAGPGDRDPPCVLDVLVGPSTTRSISLGVLADEPVSASIEWGTSVRYGNRVESASTGTRHRLQIPGLEAGHRYHARVVLRDGAGNVGRSGDFTFETARVRPWLEGGATSDYAVGLYAVADPSVMGIAGGTAFNIIQSYQSSSPAHNSAADVRRYLDDSRRAGVKALVGFENVRVDSGDLAYVRARVRALKDHPALYGWYAYDEPENPNPNDDTPDRKRATVNALANAYRAIKREDSARPVVIASYALGPNYAYRSGFDYAILDRFPIPYGGPADIVPVLERARRSGKPYHFVFQAYASDLDHRWPTEGPGVGRFPTREEMRAMAYLSVNHGARGLWAFSYNYLHDPPGSEWKWVELQELAAEIKALGPLLGSRDVPRVRASVLDRALDVGVRSYRGEDYLLIVNKEPKPVKAWVSLTGVSVGAVESMDRGAVPVTGSGFNDEWGAYEVRVYRAK